MKKEIAIWGTENIGRNMFYKLRENYRIVCWYDDKVPESILYGLKVKKFYKNKSNERIIVADHDWRKICIELQKKGLRIIDDYIPYWIYNKKMISWKDLLSVNMESIEKILLHLKNQRSIAVIYGNCQTEIIQRFLAESEEFITKYIIINIPRVCQESDAEWDAIIRSKLFSFCDLFIYQIVSDNNKYGVLRSTSKIIELLTENCFKISIPNIYFDGYFPQIEKNKYNVLEDVQEDGLFKWGDKFVNELLANGVDKNEIVKIIFDEKFLPRMEIQKCIDDSFENLKQREKNTNIKISDYILDYYKERQLFFSPNHPNNELLLECAQRILDFLGMEKFIKTEPVNFYVSLMGEDVVIYPSVIKTIGLKKFYKSFFPNRYIENLAYSATAYYELYCQITNLELLKIKKQ